MSVPLIRRSGPVTRLDRAQRLRDPHVAVVYATADGRLEVLDDGRPLGLADQVVGRFRRRYEVDMTDHHRTVELRTSPPPAQGGVYHFETLVNIGFRVTDPRQVVHRNVGDGLRVVTDYLMFAFRDITSAFPIEAAKDAEDAINNHFRNGVTIEGCILLYFCRARLKPDATAGAYLRREQEARWDNLAKSAEHERDADDARRVNDIDLIRQGGTLEQRARERDALGGRPFSMQDLLALHIERNPGDTQKALEMAVEIEARQAAYRDKVDDRNWDRFQYLADRNLVQAPEMGQIRDSVVRGAAQSPAPITAGTGKADWDDPLPEPDRPGAAVAAHRPATDLPGLIPVYVVVDESAAMATGIDAANAGLQSMYDALAHQRDIAAVVRLCVMSYTETALVRMPVHAAQGRARLPAFTVGPGPVRLAPMFEQLLDRIPQDAEALKRETPSLRRPQVLLLIGGEPIDDLMWTASRRVLIDRTNQRYAPDIIACGVGEATPRTALGVATRPELAFIAQSGDLATSIDRFWAFAQHRAVEYGRAVLHGDQGGIVTCPVGFRPAAEPPSSPNPGE